MTNSIKQSENKNKKDKQNQIILIGAIMFVVLIIVFIMAYIHGDGTAYSTGYEMGKTLGNFVSNRSLKHGVGLGNLVAALMSWDRNKSIKWAFLHAFCGWIYIGYNLLTNTNEK